MYAVHVEYRKCTDEPTEPGVINTAYVANAVSWLLGEKSTPPPKKKEKKKRKEEAYNQTWYW